MSLAIMISYNFLSSLKEISQFSMIQCLSHNWLSDVCLNISSSQMAGTSFRSKHNESKELSVFRNHWHVVGRVNLMQFYQILWFITNLRRRSWRRHFFFSLLVLGVRGNRSIWLLRVKVHRKIKKEMCVYVYVCMWIIRCPTEQS